jgi:hypothetical protein
MARPREFDEATVLEAAMNCFWAQGFESTSVRDLAEEMGITGASLYQRLRRQAIAVSSGIGSLPRNECPRSGFPPGAIATIPGNPRVF